MVVTGKEEHLVALHALVSGQQVVHGRLQRVAHVQLAGDVRWRKAHRELRLVTRRVRNEETIGFPARVPAGLDGLRIECFRHLSFFLHGRV